MDSPCVVVADGYNELQENCSLMIAAVDERVGGGGSEMGRPKEGIQEMTGMHEDDLLNSLMRVAVDVDAWVVGFLPHEPRRREFAS